MIQHLRSSVIQAVSLGEKAMEDALRSGKLKKPCKKLTVFSGPPQVTDDYDGGAKNATIIEISFAQEITR